MLHINTIRATRNRLYYLFVLLTKFLLEYSLKFFHFLLTVRWFCYWFDHDGIQLCHLCRHLWTLSTLQTWCTSHVAQITPVQTFHSIHLSFIRLRAHCSFQYENQSTREERSIGSQSVNHGNLDQIRPNNVILERTKIIIWSR